MKHDPGVFEVRKTIKICFEIFPAPPRVWVLERLLQVTGLSQQRRPHLGGGGGDAEGVCVVGA